MSYKNSLTAEAVAKMVHHQVWSGSLEKTLENKVCGSCSGDEVERPSMETREGEKPPESLSAVHSIQKENLQAITSNDECEAMHTLNTEDT